MRCFAFGQFCGLQCRTLSLFFVLKFAMKQQNLLLLHYAVKVSLAVAVAYWLGHLSHYLEYGWCVISAILVLTPDGSDAYMLAWNRVKANLTGVSGGFVLLAFGLPEPWNMVLAVALTLFLCHMLKLNDVSRPAQAAAVIVLMQYGETHTYAIAVSRAMSVIVGCAVGLGVTALLHIRTIRKRVDAVLHPSQEA